MNAAGLTCLDGANDLRTPVGFPAADDDRPMLNGVAENPRLNAGYLRSEVIMQGKLGPRVDRDPTQDQAAIGRSLDPARLGEGVSRDAGGVIGFAERRERQAPERKGSKERDEDKQLRPQRSGHGGDQARSLSGRDRVSL